MNDFSFAQNVNVMPVLSPADIVAVATPTQYVDLRLAHSVLFAVQFGAMTSDSTDAIVVTLECSTSSSSNASESAMAFKYRLSSAVGGDSMGAISSATSSGASINATDDGKVLLVSVEPSAVAAVGADFRYARLVITPDAAVASCNVSAIAFLAPRYAGDAMPSST